MAGRHGPPLDLSLSKVHELSSRFRVRCELDRLAHQRKDAETSRGVRAWGSLACVGGAVELLAHNQPHLGAAAAVGATVFFLYSTSKNSEISNIDTQALILDTVLAQLPEENTAQSAAQIESPKG